MSDFCSISAIFCSLSVSISLLGHAPSFLGEISHDTIVVAPFLSFLNMSKSCCLVFCSWRKMQNKTKTKQKQKSQWWEKSLTSYLHNGSTLEHNLDRFWKLQCRATTFAFVPFLAIGYVTTLLLTHWMDPISYFIAIMKNCNESPGGRYENWNEILRDTQWKISMKAVGYSMKMHRVNYKIQNESSQNP